MTRFSLFIAVLAVAASGCRADVRLLLDVTEDGAGTMATEVGIDQQLRDLIDQFAGDSDAIISGLDLGLEGTSTTRFEDDMTIYTTTVAFSDTSEVADAAAGNFTSFSLDLTEAGASLEATLDLAGEVDLAAFPVDPATIGPETLQAQILVSLPGDPAENNADDILVDGRYVWTIPLDGDLYMFANTVYPKSSFPWWLVGLLALSVGLALAVWLAAVRREKTTGAGRRPPPQPPSVGKPAPESTSSELPPSPFFDLDR